MKKKVAIRRITGTEEEEIEDLVVTEKHFEIFVNGKRLGLCCGNAGFICSGDCLEALSAGILFTRGIINKKSDIISLKINGKRCHADVKEEGIPCLNVAENLRLDTSRFALSERPGITISPRQIFHLAEELENSSSVFRQTGGVHSAGLADCNQILVFFEDVSRHNAVDKVLGQCILKDIDTTGMIFLLSGRITAEVIARVCRTKISIIISRAAVTTLAIELAEKAGMTVVGFARGKRFNIYTHKERVKND
jgi:FdhD protein